MMGEHVNKSPNPEHVEGVSVGEMEAWVDSIMDQAIDAYHAEAGRIADWDGVKAAIKVALSAAQSSIQRAERERDELMKAGIDLMDQRDRLEAQLEEARKVLEPFAEVAGEYSDQEDDSHEVWKDAGPDKIIQGSFELRHFRAARSLYPSLREKQDAE
jgi:hypothetical protein